MLLTEKQANAVKSCHLGKAESRAGGPPALAHGSTHEPYVPQACAPAAALAGAVRPPDGS